MSIATAQQFLQAGENDQALQAKLHALSNSKREGMMAEVVRIAAANGFVFTPGEFESAVTEHLAQLRSGAELFETDLELVAGGKENSDERSHRTEKTQGGFWGAIIGGFLPL